MTFSILTSFFLVGFLGYAVVVVQAGYTYHTYKSCVKCEDLALTSDLLSGTSDPFSGHSDPSCATKTYGNAQCTDEQCGTVWGTVTVTYPILGSVTGEFLIRKCLANTDLGLGCHDNDPRLEKLIGETLSFLTTFGKVSVKGSVCLSDTTSICPSNYVSLYPWLVKHPYCLHIGIVVGAGIAAFIVFMLLITCCCCCCCRCCRSKSRPSPIVAVMPASHVMSIQTTSSGPPYTRLPEEQVEELQPVTK